MRHNYVLANNTVFPLLFSIPFIMMIHDGTGFRPRSLE